MKDIYERVATWNKQRYDRVYSAELTEKLLVEEVEELYASESPVEALDAMCDIAYVAFGGMWKLGLTEQELRHAGVHVSGIVQGFVNVSQHTLGTLLDFFTTLAGSDVKEEQVIGLWGCVAVSQTVAQLSGIKNELFMKALHAVCDSNATKSVKKTASDTKANDGDKGAFYKSPTVALTAIIEEAKSCQPKVH
jgi:hypothetical protein